jgi:hypothetical protein
MPVAVIAVPLIKVLAGWFFRGSLPIVGKILAHMGAQAVIFTGLLSLVNLVMNQMVTVRDGMPLVAINILGLMQVDVALSILFSAYIFAAARRFGMFGGGVSQRHIRLPGR